MCFICIRLTHLSTPKTNRKYKNINSNEIKSLQPSTKLLYYPCEARPSNTCRHHYGATWLVTESGRHWQQSSFWPIIRTEFAPCGNHVATPPDIRKQTIGLQSWPNKWVDVSLTSRRVRHFWVRYKVYYEKGDDVQNETLFQKVPSAQ